MSVFRVVKTKNYTVMSNHHLRNKSLSLKSKGLLSQMLSLPDDWDYTLSGLARINKESIDAIRTGVAELEKAGYITRHRCRDEKGKMGAIEYVIYEMPQKPAIENEPTESEAPVSDELVSDEPVSDEPVSDEPVLGKPTLENPRQLNTNILNTKLIKYPSINQKEGAAVSAFTRDALSDGEWMDRYSKNTELIKRNIEYDALIDTHDRAVIDEIVSVMAEVLTIETPFYMIEGKRYPTVLVRQRFIQLNFAKADAFLLDFSRRTKRIRNTKAYL